MIKKQGLNKLSKKYPDLLGGFYFIFVGATLLLNNFGVISWNVWQEILRFWPIILITSGVQMVFDKTYTSKLLADILGILVLLYVFAYGYSKVNVNFRIWANNYLPLFQRIYKIIPNKKSNMMDNYNFYFDRGPKYSY